MIFAAIIVGFIQGLMNVLSDMTSGGSKGSSSFSSRSIGGDSLKGWGAESIDIEIT